jgi:hypothetical protein
VGLLADMAAIVAIVLKRVNDVERVHVLAFTPPFHRFFTVHRPSAAAWLSLK